MATLSNCLPQSAIKAALKITLLTKIDYAMETIIQILHMTAAP
jgi:hypothetical protein